MATCGCGLCGGYAIYYGVVRLETMSAPARRRFTFREYVRLEEYSNVRHEFFDGVIYAMAGGTPEHAALAARIIRQLGVQLEGKPCEVFTSDLRVRVATTGLATYPDVTVVCGQLETDPEDASTVLNPTVLIEVLSESTAEYDRGEKLGHYKQIAPLCAVVLFSHAEAAAEVWQRRSVSDPWTSCIAGVGDSVMLLSIACTLAIEDLYRELPLKGTAETAS
jgi:Uma2 family endonuclease